MEIFEFDPQAPGNAALTAELVDLAADTAAADRDGFPVCRHRFAAELADNHNDEMDRDVWLARRDGRIIGAAWLVRYRQENSHLAQLNVVVGPEHRRQGVGSALAVTAERAAAADGRRALAANGTAPLPGRTDWSDTASGFAERHGFRFVNRLVGRRLDVVAAKEREDRLWAGAQAASADYDLVGWVGRIPDEHAEGLAGLMSIVNGEVPHGDLEVQDMVVDVERIRADERRQEPLGTTTLYVAAVHRDTGETGGYTTIRVQATLPEHAGVGITLVHPGHRGRRIGLATKIAAQRMLRGRFPAVRWLETGNDDTNHHMIAINEQLGFEPCGTLSTYQKTP
jgi:GNAT superfamily N-acetyltransferase